MTEPTAEDEMTTIVNGCGWIIGIAIAALVVGAIAVWWLS